MNRKLVKMNEQESLALIEALSTNKTVNQNHLKKIEANRSDTQQILNKRPPKFLSIVQQLESISNLSKEKTEGNTSKYKLRRSKRIMHAGNLLVSSGNNDLTNV